MSLSLALNSAQSALSTTAQQTAIVSRSITGANDPSYARKSANLTTTGLGTITIASITRATDQALYARMLEATSDASSKSALLDGIERLAATIGDPQDDYSIAGALGAFQNALQMHADVPSDPILASEVLSRSMDLAERVNTATQTVQAARATADGEMAASVERINDLLARFETANRAIVVGTAAGNDVTDHLDTRAQILTDLSKDIGISTVSRAGGDMAIYTDSGVTLFEKTPRAVTFDRTFAYASNITGQSVYADGVAIAGPAATMEIKSGALHGHAILRDETAVTYQLQIDELARGLVEAVAEPGPAEGIFRLVGGPPPVLEVNPAIDPALGGDLTLIRDGINVNFNPTVPPSASYSGRLQGLLDALGTQRAFAPAAGVDPNTTVVRFAAGSVGWLEATRKQADAEATYQTTFLERTAESLSNETGVNLDEELALMLELERSYGASARIITAVDTMLASLLDAVR